MYVCACLRLYERNSLQCLRPQSHAASHTGTGRGGRESDLEVEENVVAGLAHLCSGVGCVWLVWISGCTVLFLATWFGWGCAVV